MRVKGRSDIPDLHTKLESFFDQVWRSEGQTGSCGIASMPWSPATTSTA